MRVGAIDIGSNSVRLLVAEIAESSGGWDGPLETIARAGEPCRLGKGLDAGGELEPELVERAATIAQEFARRARSLGAAHVVTGATAALRSARNGPAAADIISRRAGTPVRILSGDEEAQLVYRAVVLGLGGRARSSQCVVFDLGGGSTEVVSGVGAHPGRWTSLPFGAVTLTERLLPNDPASPLEIAGARERIASDVMHECALFPERTHLLAGVGGTVTVLASMDRNLLDYDPAQLEGWIVERERAQVLVERLISASSGERRFLPIMGEGRADIIGAGALVVEALMNRFQATGLVCSTQGLRFGLARLAAEEHVRLRAGG